MSLTKLAVFCGSTRPGNTFATLTGKPDEWAKLGQQLLPKPHQHSIYITLQLGYLWIQPPHPIFKEFLNLFVRHHAVINIASESHRKAGISERCTNQNYVDFISLSAKDILVDKKSRLILSISKVRPREHQKYQFCADGLH